MVKTIPQGGVPDPVDTEEAFSEMISALEADPGPVAVDAERSSGFRYGQPTVLVQFKTASGRIFLVDTLAISDLSPAQAALSNRIWILHDADQDLRGIAELGLQADLLFDTEVAARLCGMRRFGLAAVCEQLLGVTLEKEHQAADWSVRPIPRDWLRYAALDVDLLHPLYEILSSKLKELGRLEWAEQNFAAIMELAPRQKKPDQWRKGAAGKLTTPRQFATLRELWLTREEIAEEIDMSPSRLLNTSAMISVAAHPPRTRRELNKNSAFRSPRARQFEDEWMDALDRAKWMDEDDLPPVRRSTDPSYFPCYATSSYLRHRSSSISEVLKERVHKLAKKLDLEPMLIAPTAITKHLGWLLADFECADDDVANVEAELEELGCRQWQIDLIEPLTHNIPRR
ncbi:hypothetical protein BM477_03385 [Boudabousia marimammalium]|uniref:HRDC domain-containing protein n=2 Tax=Boudabousia marimammalium TaxID=156892 RepID=A0A1Q5PRF2_9ACTO|nr:hypothetical protein BM477_03385 [Boudabousia marimammalium]